MAMLGEKFPDAQFAITGVLGPGSNAHGPNEFLHLPTGTQADRRHRPTARRPRRRATDSQDASRVRRRWRVRNSMASDAFVAPV